MSVQEVERVGLREENTVKVNFPFVVTLEHPAVGLEKLFELTEAIDLYEMEKDPTGQHDLVKEIFMVDVLEVAPKSTILKITPVQPLTYTELGRHVARMVKRVRKDFFKGDVKVAHIAWEISKTGVASDLRGMLRSVQ